MLPLALGDIVTEKFSATKVVSSVMSPAVEVFEDVSTSSVAMSMVSVAVASAAAALTSATDAGFAINFLPTHCD